jgi:hypothetical protein
MVMMMVTQFLQRVAVKKINLLLLEVLKIVGVAVLVRAHNLLQVMN